MQLYTFGTARAALSTICMGGVLLLAACSGSGAPGSGLLDNLLSSSPEGTTTSALAPAPEQESCGTPAQCKSALKTMVDDPKRSWVGRPQPPAAYADGTRLFAYRALRKRLTCGELTAAVDEVHTASKSLSGPVAGMSPDQVARTHALSSEVETELTKERAKRCRTLSVTSGRSPTPAVPTSAAPGK